jgi:hypothetical protein
MRKLILMSLIAATGLSPVAVSAAEIATPARGASAFANSSDFQREGRGERRAERREARGQSGGGFDRAERQNNRAERQQYRMQRQQQAAPIQQNDGQPRGRYYDRNRDGNLDRNWDRNRDNRLDRNWDRNGDGQLDRRWDRNNNERLDRNWDRNRDGQLDRRYDRNNNERLDRRYDRNRDGNLDRRWDRNNDNRVDRWNPGWRNDRRYDWRGYRQQYRNYYRPGRYHSPYRDYSYRRFGIGITIGSAFYGSRYWINDPWQYRLPAAYGPYRWVRYYDDVLLVDLRNGRVVDVIYDFFW